MKPDHESSPSTTRAVPPVVGGEATGEGAPDERPSGNGDENGHDREEAPFTAAPIVQVPLQEIMKEARLEVAPSVQRRLADAGIDSLDQWRRAGGLTRLAEHLDLDPKDPSVRALDHLAQVGLLRASLRDSIHLVNKGYSGPDSIAREPLLAFLDKVAREIEAEEAGAIHAVASAQAELLTHALTDVRVRASFESGAFAPQYLPVTTCGCEACLDASSPMAYLADLLDYTVRHVRQTGGPLGLTALQTRFHQPFADLPVACAQLTKTVFHARIAVEILREHLNNRAELPNLAAAAYLRLLEGIGTSYEELRTAVRQPGAGTELARRLMLPDPGMLDSIFFDPSAPASDPRAVGEGVLMTVFGLRASNLLSLEPDNDNPWLLAWRQLFLHAQWQEQDAAPASDQRPLGGIPVIDPDLVQLEDVDLTRVTSHSNRNAIPKTEWSALDFLEDRAGTLNSVYSDLRQTIPGPAAQWRAQVEGLLDSLQNPMTFGTGATGLEGIRFDDLLKLRAATKLGEDISATLESMKLTLPELDALGTVAEMARDQGPVLSSEWDDLYEVMIDRIKHFAFYPSWLEEEKVARVSGSSSGIALGPMHFRRRPSTARAWTAGRFRANAAARRRWEDLLSARTDQWNGLAEAMRTVVDDVEGSLLLDVRNVLLIEASRPGTLSAAKLKKLTDTYQLDFETTADSRTTRVAQATQTLQGILFGIRNGLLDDLSLSLEAAQFDREWRWLGSYVTWRAAMLVFVYPENALRPTLRRQASPAFEDLLASLRELDVLTPANLQAPLQTYSDYFKDVSQLRSTGIRLTLGLLPPEARRTPISLDGQAASDVVAIAQAEASGRSYYSVWERDPGHGLSGSPAQTYWRAIAALPAKAELLGMLSVRTSAGDPVIGMYFRTRAEGKYQHHYAHWAPGQHAKAASAARPPSLLCASANTTGFISSAPGKPPRPEFWRRDVGDTFCAAELDGNGRDEILVLAGQEANGTRRAGVCRELCGDLVLDAAALLPRGWRIPDPANPVLLPADSAQRVLVVNDDLNQVAAIGLVNGAPAIVGATAIGNLLGLAFDRITSVGLSLKFLSIGNPGLVIVAAYKVGDDPVGAGRGLAPVGTWLAALSFGQDQFSLRQTPVEMKMPASADAAGVSPLSNVHSVRCETFVPVTKFYSSAHSSPSVSQDLLFFLGRTELDRDASGGLVSEVEVTRRYLGVLSWTDPGFALFTGTAPQVYSQDIVPSSTAGSEWSLGDGDQFVSLRLREAATSGHLNNEVVAHNATAQTIAVIASTLSGLQVISRANDQIEPESPEDEPWSLKPGDRVFAAALTGRPTQRLYVLNAEEAQLAELVVDGASQLKVGEKWKGRVPFPGTDDIAGWPLTSTDRLFAANLDGDEVTELVALSHSADVPISGILKPLPPRIPSLPWSVPDRYGPVGVTVPDLKADRGSAAPQRIDAIAEAYQKNLGNEPNLIYLDEAYFYVPTEIAIRLRLSGHYTEALDLLRSLYDYSRPPGQRSSYRLVLDQGSPEYVRDASWLLDPLDPHAIAQVRKGSYTRFTLLTIISCLLEFADSAFAEGTAESIPRARELYLRALDLLDAPELKLATNGCNQLIGEFTTRIGEGETVFVFHELEQALGPAALSPAELEAVLGRLEPILRSERPAGEKYQAGLAALAEAGIGQRVPDSFAAVMKRSNELKSPARSVLLSDEGIARNLDAVAASLRAARSPVSRPAALRRRREKGEPLEGGSTGRIPGWWQHEFVPAPSLAFCIPPNPVITALRSRAELALRKLRSGRNIAGLLVQIEAYGLPTAALAAQAQFGTGDTLPAVATRGFKPLPYRYAQIVERTKQLIEVARQMEASMLNFLEAADQRRYEELKARQDLALARSASYLKELQVNEAQEQVTLADLQRNKVRVHRDHLRGLIAHGTTTLEDLSLASQAAAAVLQTMSAASSIAAAATDWMHVDFVGAGDTAQALSSSADAARTLSGVMATSAGYERRAQEWRHEVALADEDVTIGSRQIALARDGVAIVTQERTISRMQVDHAEQIMDFMINKRFDSADLFEWMSGVMQGVYRYFLQQATVMAKQAEVQLAFERQEAPVGVIKDDYWEKPGKAMTPDFTSSARGDNVRGLTGSARLLRDLWELDQYAFKKNQRKLQLVETLSLAQLDPFAFQLFRQTGILYFLTPTSHFDRQFPGHYLRLIKRIRVSMVALIPPGRGIKAMLSTTGSSRVVIGGDVFQTVAVQRGPETVALTSPQSATGTFELDAQPELLAPCEGVGVDAAWALELPKAANLFDYDSIADVLFTIEYTALHSYDYRELVLSNMDRRFMAERAFSFRNDFADAWYDLHNPDDPDDATTPLEVVIDLRRGDFPFNLESLSLTELVIFFAPSDGQAIPIAVHEFVFRPASGAAPVPAQASDSKITINEGGIISTRRGLWNFFKGIGEPFGTWRLKLSGSMKAGFNRGLVKDILFVVSYRARLPRWPS